jgi:hypothetical protein
MADLFEHIERHFGRIAHGWTHNANKQLQPFQVVECNGGAVVGATVFFTLGLSRFPLDSAAADKKIRHELFIATPQENRPKATPSVLQQIGGETVRSGKAWLRGQVLGPRGPLFGSPMTAFYVMPAIGWPDAAAIHVENNGTRIVMARLVPITASEARFVHDHGWEPFEKILLDADSDLLDFERDPVV